jgi:hypothetical protein
MNQSTNTYGAILLFSMIITFVMAFVYDVFILQVSWLRILGLILGLPVAAVFAVVVATVLGTLFSPVVSWCLGNKNLILIFPAVFIATVAATSLSYILADKLAFVIVVPFWLMFLVLLKYVGPDIRVKVNWMRMFLYSAICVVVALSIVVPICRWDVTRLHVYASVVSPDGSKVAKLAWNWSGPEDYSCTQVWLIVKNRNNDDVLLERRLAGGGETISDVTRQVIGVSWDDNRVVLEAKGRRYKGPTVIELE